MNGGVTVIDMAERKQAVKNIEAARAFIKERCERP